MMTASATTPGWEYATLTGTPLRRTNRRNGRWLEFEKLGHRRRKKLLMYLPPHQQLMPVALVKVDLCRCGLPWQDPCPRCRMTARVVAKVAMDVRHEGERKEIAG